MSGIIVILVLIILVLLVIIYKKNQELDVSNTFNNLVVFNALYLKTKLELSITERDIEEHRNKNNIEGCKREIETHKYLLKDLRSTHGAMNTNEKYLRDKGKAKHLLSALTNLSLHLKYPDFDPYYKYPFD